MIRKNLTFALLGGIILLATSACNSSKKETDNAYESQTSLDWQGTYSGILPCADCEGIETELTLKEDNSYKRISKYLGRDNNIADTLTGTFSWEGNNIKLGGINEAEGSSLYKVEENQLRHLDMDGKIIEGDLEQFYILKKNGNPLVEDKKWQLMELYGKAVNGSPETHYLIFNSKTGQAEANANCNTLQFDYKIKNELLVSFTPTLSTRMACPDNTEQELLQVLSEADNLTSDGEHLTLNKARMSPLARFAIIKE